MDMKREYYEDIELCHSNFVRAWFVVLMLSLLLLPIFVKGYYVYVVNLIFINIIVALGLNLLVGYTGQISLGHAGFFAIGAYTSVLLMTKANIPFLLALPAAGIVSALFGFLLGLPALRLTGPYLAIATLGFGMAITQVIGHWEGLFGGRMGIVTPKISLGGFILSSDKQMYYLIMILAVAMSIAARNIVKTRVGRAFIAIRDSDIAAETLGVNLTLYKTLSFALSAFYTGIAGSLWAHILGFINPASFNLILSIMFLSMIVVGGLGSIPGSIFGAILITVLQIELNNIPGIPLLGPLVLAASERWFSVSGLANVSSIIFGSILVLIMIFEPLGMYGLWIRAKIYFKTWPF